MRTLLIDDHDHDHDSDHDHDHDSDPRHGGGSPVLHDGTGKFVGIPSPRETVRHHSWAVARLSAARPVSACRLVGHLLLANVCLELAHAEDTFPDAVTVSANPVAQEDSAAREASARAEDHGSALSSRRKEPRANHAPRLYRCRCRRRRAGCGCRPQPSLGSRPDAVAAW